jgi:hypothetical protein
MDTLTNWQREQINSRPTAKRKIYEEESRLAGLQWRKSERRKLTLNLVSIGAATIALVFGTMQIIEYITRPKPITFVKDTTTFEWREIR